MSRRSVYYKPTLADQQAMRAALAKSAAAKSRDATVRAMRAALVANPPRAPTNSSRAASIVNRRLSPNAPEMKHVDVSLQTTVLTNTNWGTFVLLNGVNQGVANYQRVGNKLSPVSVDVDFFVTNMTTTNFQPFRIALIWDKQPKTDGTLPSITDIWADVQSDGVIYCTPLSGRNYQTTDRFVCLASQECYLLANNVNSGGKHTQPTLDPFS